MNRCRHDFCKQTNEEKETGSSRSALGYAMKKLHLQSVLLKRKSKEKYVYLLKCIKKLGQSWFDSILQKHLSSFVTYSLTYRRGDP